MGRETVNSWRGGLWAFAPLFLWIGVIFFLSSPQGSLSETSRIIGPLLSFFFPDMSETARQIVHGYVRKSAHFTEYAVLAVLVARASVSHIRLTPWRYVLPLVVVIIVAMLDEFNQSFSSVRTSSIWDVLLDISGGAAATLVLWLAGRPRPRHH